MARLNYHHLHYFWAVAKDGNLTRTAAQLHVSQSALSTQIKQLEDQLGQALFSREGRALQLTEAGRVALTYADTIFETGNELTALLRDGQRQMRQILRIGGVATLSRNFQENFVKPLIKRDDIELVIQSASLDELLTLLAVHRLDVVLSNRKVHADSQHPWRCRRVARQPVSLVGKPRSKSKAFRFPEELTEQPLLLPGRDSDIRAGFDVLCEQLGLRYQVLAEVDDMAMLRLLARDSGNVALLPTVVVQDELRSGKLQEYCVVPQLYENFYAITVQRHFEPPLLKTLLRRSEAEVLGSA
ncbi:MAG: LysR family transcriptional regulator [Polaromonas sp.]|jgi:LysR family transcriptional activator of nhaA